MGCWPILLFIEFSPCSRAFLCLSCPGAAWFLARETGGGGRRLKEFLVNDVLLRFVAKIFLAVRIITTFLTVGASERPVLVSKAVAVE